MNSTQNIFKQWPVLVVIGLFTVPAFGQTTGDLRETSQSYIGFKSAEDKGQILDNWFRLGPLLPGTAAPLMPGISETTQYKSWSVAGRHDEPLSWSADYVRQQDIFASGNSGQAWRVTGAYRLMDAVTVGASYGRLFYSPIAAQSLENAGWSLFGDWHIKAAHTLRAGYVKAGAIPTAPASLASVNARLVGGGADMWQLLYEYAFSQRTTLDVRYANSGSEAGAFYLNSGEATPSDFGLEQRSLGLGVRHQF